MKESKTSCLRVIFTIFIFHFAPTLAKASLPFRSQWPSLGLLPCRLLSWTRLNAVLFLASLFICTAALPAQVASRTDGVNVFYYDSLFEAVAAAEGVSVEKPDEITLLADIVLDEALIVDDGVHIRLVPDGLRTIRRSAHLIEFPLMWVRGENSSLSLGKPGMEWTRTEPLSGVASTMRGSPLHELVIDGGRFNSPPIEAHAPLVAVSGLDAKLIMYDKVILQNNINNGLVPLYTWCQNGAGVFVRTQDDIPDRPAEFIMKGGIIRGNMNDTENVTPYGGGVLVIRIGIFTMEGGVIMNNATYHSGGGVCFALSRVCSFKKTGGIIYGSNAPAGYRNTAITGLSTPKTYGHALGVAAIFELLLGYRDDTVGENDNLSFSSDGYGNFIFGTGEKWDTPDKALRRLLLVVILPIIAILISAILIQRKRTLKLAKIIQEAADSAANAGSDIDLENTGLSDREKDLCELLLTDRPLKDIAAILGLGYSGTHVNAQKLYAKLGIQSRTELLIRVKSEKGKGKSGE